MNLEDIVLCAGIGIALSVPYVFVILAFSGLFNKNKKD